MMTKQVYLNFLTEIIKMFKKGIKINNFYDIERFTKSYSNEIKVKKLRNI